MDTLAHTYRICICTKVNDYCNFLRGGQSQKRIERTSRLLISASKLFIILISFSAKLSCLKLFVMVCTSFLGTCVDALHLFSSDYYLSCVPFRVASHSLENKMPVASLAKVFGPTIIGYRSANPDATTVWKDTQHQAKVSSHTRIHFLLDSDAKLETSFAQCMYFCFLSARSVVDGTIPSHLL